MNERLLKRIFNAEVMGLVLVCIALQVLLHGVELYLRGTDSDHLYWLCLAAAVIGLWAGMSRSGGVQASAALAALGIVVVWILGARIASPIFGLVRSVIANGPHIFPSIQYRFDVDLSAISTSWNTICLSSLALLGRWQTWFIGFAKETHVNDTLIRTMIWTFALWLLSAWIGWFASRRNAVASLLPGAILLTVITYNTERRIETLWALVIIMLLLMGIWNYEKLIQQWESHRIDYSESIRYDNTQAIVLILIVVGAVAYLTPSISWRDVRDYLRELERERESQRQTTTTRPASSTTAVPQLVRPASQATLPREHLLTSGAARSETIVMTIKTGELSPVMMQSLATHAPRYYWRSAVFDQYVGAGWFTSSAPAQLFAANEPLIAGVIGGYKLLHLDVQMQQPEGTLFWSGMLYSADIPLSVNWRVRPQSGLFAYQTVLLQADMFAARTDAVAYKADVFVPIPSVEQLRSASTDYPELIRDRYLTLPASVPARVHRLAEDITRGKETPYDRAKAIESYLRTNYPYDLTITAPPKDQDVADYFLFDLRRGYCDYYATAMVVLARSSGLPARFVSGYAPGEYDAPNAQYVIRELHAHSWAEVYFSEIGWVEFEPTGHEPEIVREDGREELLPQNKPDSITRQFLVTLTNRNWLSFLIPVGVVVGMVWIYFTFIERLLFMRLEPAIAIEILYKRLYRSGRPLAGEFTRAETVYEFKNKLLQRIQHVYERLKLKRAPHTVSSDVEQLTTIYQSSLFSEHGVDERDVKIALQVWARLRWSLFIERIKYSLSARTKQRMDRVN